MKKEQILYKIDNEDPCLLIVSEPFISKYSSDSVNKFDRIQKIAEQTKGIVMPGLNTKIINVLKVEPHNFNSDKPLVEAQKWAEVNLVGIYTAHKGTINEFEYQISRSAIHKYLSPSATDKSENISVHLSTLKSLIEIINTSIEIEIHCSYIKSERGRNIESPIDKTILIHRFYGLINHLNNMYRIKTTIKEYRDTYRTNKPYTFEAIKIELLDESNSPTSASNGPNSHGGLSIRVANILQNVEKSYDKGKFLLEESEKSIDYFRRSIL